MHLVELAVRPDVELKRVMSAVSAVLHGPVAGRSRLQFAFLQRNHGLISRASTDGRLSQTPPPAAEPEWDLVDVQVCLSRDTRRRVLLFQFLKALNNNNGAFDSSAINKVRMSQN